MSRCEFMLCNAGFVPCRESAVLHRIFVAVLLPAKIRHGLELGHCAALDAPLIFAVGRDCR
jgi:hypothetical protein